MSSPALLRLWRGAAPVLLDAVLPPLCLGCNEIVGTPGCLCPACWTKLDFVAPPCCVRCARPFARAPGPAALCTACSARPPRWRRARAALVYDGRSRQLVLPFKHGDRTDMARACGRWMARAGADLLAGSDLVAPVPLHWRRLFLRRYNQAQLLARMALAAAPPGGARLVPVPLHWTRLVARRFNQAAELTRHLSARTGLANEALLLKRVRRTRHQVGLTRAQRLENVTGAFRIAADRRGWVRGKRLVLVDDVLTTGATVEACAIALQRGGAAAVDVLTLARVVRPAV